MQVSLYLAGEINQVKESIPWVRCTSGNVFVNDLVVGVDGRITSPNGFSTSWESSICERKVTQPWESNPGPTPNRGELATLVVSVGLILVVSIF